MHYIYSAVIVEWKRLKLVVCKYRLSLVVTLTTEFQTASGSNVSTKLFESLMKWASTAQMHSANCKVWWMRNNGLGLFHGSG